MLYTVSQKSEPPKHFATATANLHRFKWNFTYTWRHLFLSSTPSFIRIPYSVYEIFNSFKLLSQISVTNTTSFLADVICYFSPSSRTVLQPPAHRARECMLLSAETPDFIRPLDLPPNSPDLNPVEYAIWDILEKRVYRAARSVTSTIWKNDWLKSGIVLIKTYKQWISVVIHCINLYAQKGDTSNIWFEHVDCFDWHQLRC